MNWIRNILLKHLNFIVFLFFACSGNQNFAQTNYEHLMKSDAKLLAVDDFENIYLIDEKNSLSKYDRKLDKKYEYSFNRLGDIHEIDVSNPQKLMLYFFDYQIILFLDNTLSEIDRLDLQDLDFWNIQCITLAPDNYIWVFDSDKNKLIKIDDTGNVLYSSNELYLENITDLDMMRLTANQNYTLLYNNKRCMVFDNFGQHLKTLEIQSDKILLQNDLLFILKNNLISIEKLKADFKEYEIINIESEGEIEDIEFFKNNYLYYIDSTGLNKVRLN